MTRLLFILVTYNWHLSFIDNHWTSDNASSFTPTLIKMAQNPWQNQARGIDFKTAIVFKLGQQMGNI